MNVPSSRTVLQTLPKARLLELARTFSIAVAPNDTKDVQIDALLKGAPLGFASFSACLVATN